MIYLAGPLFNQTQQDRIRKVATILRNKDNEVYVPMEHTVDMPMDCRITYGQKPYLMKISERQKNVTLWLSVMMDYTAIPALHGKLDMLMQKEKKYSFYVKKLPLKPA